MIFINPVFIDRHVVEIRLFLPMGKRAFFFSLLSPLPTVKTIADHFYRQAYFFVKANKLAHDQTDES